MNPRRELSLAMLVLSVAPAFAASEDDVMNQMFGLVPGTIIEFCAGSVPELRTQVEATAKSFNAKALKASMPFLERLRAEGSIGQGPRKEELDETRQQILATLKTVDAPKYCAAFIKKLELSDVDAMVAAAEAQHRQYLNAAKVKRGVVSK
jgi:hypothetical protein